MDEMQILDACIFGSTVGEIAEWTAFPVSKVRRLVKRLEKRQLLRRSEYKSHSTARPAILWTREGPGD